tara:strand:+ start:1421 stop:2410 length:990 start_codon:yes stop_codon:yes gene_type:complete
MKNILITMGISIMLTLSSNASEDNCEVIRGVFDIGSGSTKMKVFKWDECQDNLIEELKSCADHKKVAYKEDLKNSQELKEVTIEFGIKKLNELKKKAISCGATQFSGAATSAFRQAKNGEVAANHIANKTGVRVQIVSQELEAKLGVIGAKLKANIKNKNICIWDIGGSSMQITCEEGEKTKMYLGHLASVPFKNEVLKLKSSKSLSPNPIGKDLLPLISQVLKSEADEIKTSLGDLLSKNVVIGIGGVHYYAVSKSVGKKTYTSDDLSPWVLKSILLDDKSLGGGDFVDTLVTNVILVEGLMNELKIKNVTAFKVNLADGVLASPSFW